MKLNQSQNTPIPVYNTMIKALGMCGDLEAAFDVFDHVYERFKLVTDDMLVHILMACISDKESGFRHAVMLWRKIRQLKITPNTHVYNLMLRAVKECGVGDHNHVQDLMIESMSGQEVRQLGERTTKQLPWYEMKFDAKEVQVLNDEQQSVLQKSKTKKTLPNFLLPTPSFDNEFIVGLSPQALAQPSGRMALLGDPQGFLFSMQIDKRRPDIKTFSQMLWCVEGTTEAERNLIDMMKSNRVQPDTDFFNQLMSKRLKRFDYSGVKEVFFELLPSQSLAPDFGSYKFLAASCYEVKEVYGLLSDMKRLGIRPNGVIFQHLIENAMIKYQIILLKPLLTKMTRLRLDPTKELVEKIDLFMTKYREIVVAIEINDEKSLAKIHPSIVRRVRRQVEVFKSEEWMEFLTFYRQWKKSVKVQGTEHPWQQFKVSTQDDPSQFSIKTNLNSR